MFDKHNPPSNTAKSGKNQAESLYLIKPALNRLAWLPPRRMNRINIQPEASVNQPRPYKTKKEIRTHLAKHIPREKQTLKTGINVNFNNAGASPVYGPRLSQSKIFLIYCKITFYCLVFKLSEALNSPQFCNAAELSVLLSVIDNPLR